MESTQGFATRDELWRIQETLNDLSSTQAHHADRIMRLEQKALDGSRSTRSLWGAASPFPGTLSSSQHDSALNPAAEAFRNFDADPGTSMMSSLTLDAGDDPRRAAASRANSVRFDESANNHYGSSRQSMELPQRTGSGLGGHAMSERSLSHRSDGRASAVGFARTNSFGLESSRLLGSIHNSPRVSCNPPPGFFILSPCPSIIRCWLTETFTNSSLLYAAICTGSAQSSVTLSLVEKLNLADLIFDDGDTRFIRLPVYLTEAKVHTTAVRSSSPMPQIPTLSVKFVVDESEVPNDAIQIVVGSDVLRSHNADILFSQDKLMILDEDRNQLSIPLVRPEDDAVYKDLSTAPRVRPASDTAMLPPPMSSSGQGDIGVIGGPGKVGTRTAKSPSMDHTSVDPSGGDLSAHKSDPTEEAPTRTSLDYNSSRTADDSKSTTGSEKSFTTPQSKTSARVWSNSWRSTPSGTASTESASKPPPSYARPSSSRQMKVLRPSKSMASANRTTTSTGSPSTNGAENGVQSKNGLSARQPHQPDIGDTKSSTGTSTKANPVGSGTAFGWLNTGPIRRTSAND
ncbi:hypothetical protein PV10_07385 [Exophiala mesophila]|uniref:Ubiquitin carboxyl-terminal hydrolase 19 n=1 Tax=Exophiala mesophila TaxID=212818 RepID=A0A0D1Z7V2_EXOME|nr:uncharacterized protein PV10_07385 [Exophiala mesophila]KIV90039.1 hypothetical protein PV10_07385 [Exophiala mesophila]